MTSGFPETLWAPICAERSGGEELAFELRTVERPLDRFWSCCHPALGPADGGEVDAGVEERAGRIEWLNLNGTAAVRRISLTANKAIA